MKKLAIITTHPIQYNAPLFKMLHERKEVEIMVFYTWSQSAAGTKYDPGFGREISWDIPLLSGYPYTFVNNISPQPGSHHFKGMDNPTLIAEIETWKADAVLVYGWSFKSHLKALKYFHKKIPVFFRGDSTLLDAAGGFKSVLRKIWLKYVYSKVDVALYAGAANKAYFLEYGLKENQLIFMPHATDNTRFAATEKSLEEGNAIRELFGISGNETVFLFAGKLEEKKQPDMLADAFANINNEHAHLIITGNGALEEKLMMKYSDNPKIHFLPFQNQSAMPGLYAACDVFVLPSKGPNETWGLCLNEAMAAGKPVIATDACGAAYDLIEENETGCMIGRNDQPALQEKMNYFAESKERATKMQEKVQEKIKQYSYEKDCEAVEKVMDGI
jgi:glycosyltransferase involved in cell wall biosynthesis